MEVFALDIETDTSPPPLDPDVPAAFDPRASTVLSAAVYDSAAATAQFFDGPEPQVLASLEQFFAETPASHPSSVLATWNGANFDLPFLAHRFQANGLATSLRLFEAEDRPAKYQPLPGLSPGGFYATWGTLSHLDVSFAYQHFALVNHVAWSLKPVAKAFGFEMVTLDASDVSSVPREVLREYNVSDVKGTAFLACRLPSASQDFWLDPISVSVPA